MSRITGYGFSVIGVDSNNTVTQAQQNDDAPRNEHGQRGVFSAADARASVQATSDDIRLVLP